MERSTLKRKANEEDITHELKAIDIKEDSIHCLATKYTYQWTRSLDEDLIKSPLFETKDNTKWFLRLEKIREKVNAFKIQLVLHNSYESEVDIDIKFEIRLNSESNPRFCDPFSRRSKVNHRLDRINLRFQFNGDSLSDSQITIRWEITHFKTETNVSENIGKNLIQNFKSIINCKEFSDLKIVVKGKVFMAHKCILSARSEYFHKLFTTGMKESNENMIEINDTEVKVFEQFLSFIYTGTAPEIGSNPKELLVCSDFYGVSDLKSICEEILCQNFTIESSIDLLLFAIKYNTKKLKERLIDFTSNIMRDKSRDKCNESIINFSKTVSKMSSIEDKDNTSDCLQEIEDNRQNSATNGDHFGINLDIDTNDTQVMATNGNTEVRSEDQVVVESGIQLNTNSDTDPKTSSEAEPEVDSNTQSSDGLRTQSVVRYIRKTSTQMIAKLWQILETIEWHKTREDLHQMLLNKMLDEFGLKFSDNRINELVDKAVADGLIAVEEAFDFQIKYSANFDRTLFGQLTNDWICFNCHSVRGNEALIDCKMCFRAFHLHCLKVKNKSLKGLDEKTFECIYCQLLRQTDDTLKVNQISKQVLNKCVLLLINNLEFSYDSQIFVKFLIPFDDKTKVLVFKAMDLMSIKSKAFDGSYDKLQEVVNDFKHFVHNYMVCVESNFKQSLDEMSKFEKRFDLEINALKLCVDCYQYSSDIAYDIADDPQDWFTLVCDPPHELVFAKFAKYPFWPAKVIAIAPDHETYDVRFFDPPEFSRGMVSIRSLRPIDSYKPKGKDIELPVELLDKHINNLKAKGVYFVPTVKQPPNKGVDKKSPNTDPKGTDLPNKRSKKSTISSFK